MKRRKITLTDQNEKPFRKLKTTIVNEFFAVHGTVLAAKGYAFDGKTSIDREEWTLTHIPTGGAVTTRGYTKEALIRAANMLLEIGDWNFTDYKDAQRFDSKEVRSVLKMSQYPNAVFTH